jgi:hypothetical protein
MAPRIASSSFDSQGVCASSDIGIVFPGHSEAKGSKPTGFPKQPEGSQSLPIAVTAVRTGEASPNQQSSGQMADGVWIGIGLGTVILLTAIAGSIWWMISRRPQEIEKEMSDSLEFVTETDEELILPLTIGGGLSRMCGDRRECEDSEAVRDSERASIGGEISQFFEESLAK